MNRQTMAHYPHEFRAKAVSPVDGKDKTWVLAVCNECGALDVKKVNGRWTWRQMEDGGEGEAR